MKIAINRVGDMKELNLKDKTNNRLAILLIGLGLVAILVFYFSGHSIFITKSRTSSYIASSSTTIYETEEALYSRPSTYKTTVIDANKNVWLGYAEDNGECYYCLHAQTGVRSKSSNQVVMKVELVFTEEEWRSGNSLLGYAVFYDQSKSFYNFEAIYRIYVSINNERVLSSNISVLKLTSAMTDSLYDSQSSIFMREMITSFDEFLDYNNIREFNRR